TSRELIYQEIPSGNDNLHINDKGVVKTIYQGNFNKSSRQMEHAILIEILSQISPSLEEANLHLDICINSDLDSNKTLANIPIVANIYADLKHLMCNIRNSLRTLRHAANDPHAPTKEETRIMQVEGLIYHLQNDHMRCWSDICWTKDDSEIILQEPTLCYLSNNRINKFRKLLEIDLVFYKKKALDWLHVNEFYPSFAPLIVDFDVTIQCICYKVFSKHSKGLCSLHYTYHQFGWSRRLINKKISLQEEINRPISLEDHIKDTLVIMKTGRGKSFCYAAASILFDGLIVVISPLKSLIQSQV
ncbi:5465_t:CDS:2, partial [Gigaspora margarita]